MSRYVQAVMIFMGIFIGGCGHLDFKPGAAYMENDPFHHKESVINHTVSYKKHDIKYR